tara:strand:+ start:271 stop:591 length:321 start_codon:yes stop_codon:yes gene_type:complete
MQGSELIDKLIEEGVKEFLILAPRNEYDGGCVGFKKETNQLIYDYNLLYASLCNSWRPTFKDEDELYDAVDDHLSYNTLRSLPYYQNPPIILLENEDGVKVPHGER